MDTLRRRIPFKIGEDEEESFENEVLDEQQQDEENDMVNHKYTIAVTLVVGLSCILHLISFKYSPLLAIFPAILALYVHLHLVFMFFSTDIQARFRLAEPVKFHSFQLLFLLSAVAPVLCLFLYKPWQTLLWWCLTPLVIFIAQTVTDAIQQNNQGISDLETLKYTAPGA
ncbi:hypothetical protein CPB84DRAFT_1774955 [Gymnopilus junonius]|uniref:Uncharacterized protein n=1 Tax=Gymnopilus junonius TaxID=109634 RepID=A0A9P5TQ90_GYMJU|nr:hypothetical protein CPB84DRAFT_1774955 [Gymnopilus junonius]